MDDSGLRLKHFLKSQDIQQQVVAEKLKVAKQYVNSICQGRKGVSKKLAATLQELIGVSAAWLLTGEGAMYANVEDPGIMSLSEFQNGEVGSVAVSQQPIGRPYYDVDFTASFEFLVNDQTTTPSYFIDFRPYNSCDCWCNVHGDSMYPTISPGDIVAMKRIEDFRYLINGKIYGIITSNGLRTIKRVRDNGDTFTLIPDNHIVGEQTIPKSIVTTVYLILGAIKQF